MIAWFVKGTFILAKRELQEAFSSPFIYIISSLFLLLIGWPFFNYVILAKQLTTLNITNSVLAPVFGIINIYFMFLTPLLTMGVLTEEKKNHTLELLFLSKLNSSQIVIGKFLAVLIMTLFLLVFTLVFPVMIALSGYGDWGMVFASYIGILFSIACYISVGLFASSLTDNPIVAAFVGVGILIIVWLLAVSMTATNNWMLGQIFQYLSITFHLIPFFRGEIRSFDFIYFLSFAGFFLWLTKQSLEARKW